MIKLLSGPKPRWNRACLVFTLLLLAGCGQKGPLYLPEPAPAEPAEEAPAAP